MVIYLTIINTQWIKNSQHSCFILNKWHKKVFHNTVVSLKNYNVTVHFQKTVIDDATNIQGIKTFID